MAAHAHNPDAAANERILLNGGARPVMNVAGIVGLAGLVVSAVATAFTTGGFRRFLFAYLVAYGLFLAIALGALSFVLLQHLTRAGWSVTVRRLAEVMAATLPVLGVMSLPLIVSVLLHNGSLYRWALPKSAVNTEVLHSTGKLAAAHEGKEEEIKDPAKVFALTGEEAQKQPRVLDELTLKKRNWLNPWFWSLRIIIYFVVWSYLALWYYRQSLLQDATKDPEITSLMQKWAPVSLIVLAVTLTLGAFDLFMALDPHWYSTMFGVYYFAGAALSSFAALILFVWLMQRFGYLQNSVTREHYHDLGKYLFGFTFFWGYIAFGQYMLLWYANIPEETEWFLRHGATSARDDMNGWTVVISIILVFRLLIPFAGLLSRHVKRTTGSLIFWAIWTLVFSYVDMYWVVMPEMGHPFYFTRHVKDLPVIGLSLVDLAALVGVGGLFIAAVAHRLAGHAVRPTADPRLSDSLAFQNV